MAVCAEKLAECAATVIAEDNVAGLMVHSVLLTGTAARIRAAGKRPFDIARKAGIATAALDDPSLLVSMRSVMTFFDLAARACQQRTWGLELGAETRLAPLIGPLWVLLRQARTVRELCRDLAHNYDLFTNAALMSFEPVEQGALLGWSAATGYVDSEVQIAEYALAVLLNEVQSHAPPGWTPGAVYIRHDAPANLRVHRRVLGPNLRFRCGFNAIEIDTQVLDRPLRGSAPGPRALTRRMLRLQADSPNSDLRLQVESLLRALLPYSASSATEVSRSLGVSTRTLQEHLKSEGTSFRAIKRAVRQDLMQQYLKYSDLSVTEIADLLGYADPTSFSRSFRCWNGRCIREARRS